MAHRAISAQVTVAWSDDSAEFYRRLVDAAVASRGFRGVRKAALWQPFHDPARAFHRSYSRAHPSIKNGASVRVLIEAGFDPSEHVGQIYSVSITDPAAATTTPSPPVPAPKPLGFELTSKVMGSHTSKAVKGAVVQLIGPGAHTSVSDSAGEVAFQDVARGEYTLLAALPNYEAYSKKVTVASSVSLPVIIWLEPIVYLKFDGAKLCVMSAGVSDQCWTAVSGAKGYQSKAHQKTKDKGPLPEGWWYVRQKEYQAMGSRGVLEKLGAELGRTAWPGGESSWGRHRIWLHPKNGTQTHGRSGFSIHGGDDPGSAGCIDMTSKIGAFVAWFRVKGKDLDLLVEY